MKVYDGTKTDQAQDAEPERLKVGIAEYEVTTNGAILTTSGLGSCIGVALYDTTTGTGGLVHVMLPATEETDGDNPAKFADSGTELLIGEMTDIGANVNGIEAKMAGGSDMLDFSDDGESIGVRNVQMVKDILDEYGIPVVGEDVGGDHGRSLRFETESGDLIVKSATEDERCL